MDRPIVRNDLKSRLLRLVKSDQSEDGAAVAGSDGQDRVIAQKPLWKRYWKHAAVAVVVVAGAVWLLMGTGLLMMAAAFAMFRNRVLIEAGRPSPAAE